MPDTNSYTFHYLTDEEQPYYLEVTYHGSTVIAGFAPGDIGDTAVFEITDKYDGKQLASVNIGHADMVNQWHDLVTKAHHLVLQLHAEAEAVKQAERDRLFGVSVDNFFEAFEAVDKLGFNLREMRGVNDEQLRQMKRAADSMRIVADALDLVEDPD